MFDIEREIIARVTDSDAMSVLFEAGIQEHHFFDPEVAPIYGYALGYFKDFGGMERAISFQALLDKFPNYLSLIEGVSGNIEPAYLAEQCKEKFTRSLAGKVVTQGAALLHGDAGQAISMMQDSLTDIVMKTSRKTDRLIYGEDMAYQEMQARKLISTETVNGMPYPFAEMQRHTNGIWPGEFVVFAGAPAKGKTWFACLTAREAMRMGWNVYFATLEMPVASMVQRIELIEAGLYDPTVPPALYATGNSGEFLPQHERLMAEARQRIANFPGRLTIEKVSRSDADVSSLFARARAHKASGIIIDQLQWVKRPTGFDSRSEAIEEAIYQMKEQADSTKQSKLSTLLLHQFNREGVAKQKSGRIGHMEDLAFSSAIEQVADAAWGIGNTLEEANNSLMKLGSLKERRFKPVGWQCHWYTEARAFFEICTNPMTHQPERLAEW